MGNPDEGTLVEGRTGMLVSAKHGTFVQVPSCPASFFMVRASFFRLLGPALRRVATCWLLLRCQTAEGEPCGLRLPSFHQPVSHA
jgi:hypothetical protein